MNQHTAGTSPMELATVFKLSIYSLSAFVGVVLGSAERGWVPFLSLPVAILAYYWYDVRAIRRDNRPRGLGEIPARVLAFLGLVGVVVEFFGNNPEGKLLAGIHMAVFLTWLFLLQEKTNGRYWSLLALGVLQIAVGSVLTNASWFGVCMIIYLFAAVWTLSVFTLYRAEREILGTEQGADDPPETAHRLRSVGQAFNTVRFEGGTKWVSLRLAGGVVTTSLAGLLVGALFFTLIPRVWVGTEFGISDDVLPAALRPATTGLATKVRVGEMGPILESNDPVLRIRLFDNQTDRPVDPETFAQWLGQEAPSFRGAVLSEYEDGLWRADRAASTTFSDVVRLFPNPDSPEIVQVVPTVRQEIRMQHIGSNVLLFMGRPVAMHDPEGYRCGLRQPATDIVIRRTWFSRLAGAVDYIAFAELPSEDSRREPGVIVPRNAANNFQISSHLKRCSESPAGLPNLVELAREIVDQETNKVGRPLSVLERARVLQSHLRNSAQFTYSLKAPTVNPQMDPIEDFLFNRHAGHCEYFASALTLMLRAVDVPARLVTGFKGGEARSDGYLYIEERHAHAWVEAWIPNGRKWITLDATPEEAREESVAAVGTKRNAWTTMTSQFRSIWESNVLEFSLERQDDMLYRPVREWFQSIWDRVKAFWDSPHTSLVGFMQFIVDPHNWLTVSGAATLAAVIALFWSIRGKLDWIRNLWKARLSLLAEPRRNPIEFYDRFAKLMQAQGHRRRIAQTQDEFVHEMAYELSSRLPDEDLSDELIPIGELFYQVRFGAGELSARQESELNDVLDRLEQSLEHRGASPAHSAKS